MRRTFGAGVRSTWRASYGWDLPASGAYSISMCALALRMTLRDYADAGRFEIQGEEGIIQVTRRSDPHAGRIGSAGAQGFPLSPDDRRAIVLATESGSP